LCTVDPDDEADDDWTGVMWWKRLLERAVVTVAGNELDEDSDSRGLIDRIEQWDEQ